MANPQALKSLLIDLKRVRSPVQRMKLLALAWRTVRELSPSERDEIASELGMKQLGGFLERLGKKEDGIAPAEVLQALDGVDDDPVKLGALVGGLRDPARRKEILRRGVGILDDWLKDEDEDGPEEEVEDAAVEAEIVVEPATETEAIDDVIEPEEAESVAPASPSTPDPAAEPAATGEPIDVLEATLRPETHEDATPQGEAHVEPAAQSEPLDEEAVIDEPADLPALGFERFTEAATLTSRFRALRDLLAADEPFRDLAPGEVVALFPDGWPRRRVVCLLLRAGLVRDSAEALSLVRRLSRTIDRRWCVLALIDSLDLTPDDAIRLEEEFPIPAVRRRLRTLADSA